MHIWDPPSYQSLFLSTFESSIVKLVPSIIFFSFFPTCYLYLYLCLYLFSSYPLPFYKFYYIQIGIKLYNIKFKNNAHLNSCFQSIVSDFLNYGICEVWLVFENYFIRIQIFIVLVYYQKRNCMQNILRPSQKQLSERQNKSAHFCHKSQVQDITQLQKAINCQRQHSIKMQLPQEIQEITYSKINQFDQNTLTIFEGIGMFIFTYGQLCVKESIGIHLQISLLLFIAIPFCGRVSGANFNPSVSIGFNRCAFDRYGYQILWLYFKTQFYAAFIAQIVGHFINNNHKTPLLPPQQISNGSIILSQFLGCFSLVFFILLLCDQRTSPVRCTEPIVSLTFIILMVFVSRKFAVNSFNAVNPAITLSQATLAVFTDLSLVQLKNSVYFIIGDILGALAGVYCEQFVSGLKYSLINYDRSKQRAEQYSEMQLRDLSHKE